MNKLVKGVVITLSLALGVLGGTAVAVAGDSAPPAPPWVKADGTIDESKLPDKIGVVDNRGQVVRDEHGRLVTVDMRPALPGEPGSVTEPSLSVKRYSTSEDGLVEEHETRGGRGFKQGKQ